MSFLKGPGSDRDRSDCGGMETGQRAGGNTAEASGTGAGKSGLEYQAAADGGGRGDERKQGFIRKQLILAE